jgi:CheY-like chemotaxis protein
MKPIDILLVEDNDGDILLTKEALESKSMINHLAIAKNGVEAIAYVTDMLENTSMIFPDLILLDINLPKKNGHEVLDFIKSHEHLKQIPVIMLTTSSADKDVLISYQKHANCYITKPVDINSFMDTISKVEDFWTSVVSLPKHYK